MRKLTLSRVEELHTTLPAPKPKPQYNGCLSEKERQVMAEIYKEAKIRKVSKRPAKLFDKYRPEF